jgi:hypothetical protein
VGAIAIAAIVSIIAAGALTRPADTGSAATNDVTLDPATLQAIEQVAGADSNVIV